MGQSFVWITTAVSPFWLLMILAPGWSVTKRVMASKASIIGCGLIHIAIVGAGLTESPPQIIAEKLSYFFNEAVVSLPAMSAMRQLPSFVTEEWAHVLVWDLFAGRAIYLDAQEKDIPCKHSLLAAFALGPVGILSHYTTEAVLMGWRGRREGASE